MVWRALSQAAQPANQLADTGEHSGRLQEMLRWLSEDAMVAPGETLGSSEAHELLLILAPALRDRNSGVRAGATRTLHVLAQARGGGEHLRADVHDSSQLSNAFKATVLTCLDSGPPPTPAIARTPSTVARTPQASDPSSPMPSSDTTLGSSSANRARRGSTSRPRRLRFTPQVERSAARRLDTVPSPAPESRHMPSPLLRPSLEAVEASVCQSADLSVDKSVGPQGIALEACGSPVASAAIRELEQTLVTWHTELAHVLDTDGKVWLERAGLLHRQLEHASLHQGCTESAALIPATLNVCKQLVHAGAVASGDATRSVDRDGEASAKLPLLLFEAALAVARAANATFSSLAVNQLCSTAAVTSFRAVLHALARLQQFSKSSVPWAQRAAAPLLLELPPVLACIIDKMEAPVQLLAWMRVAAEVVEEEVTSKGPGASSSAAAARRWALRFCTRCVDRCAAQVPLGYEGFPAWDVLSEVLRFHERRHLLEGSDSATDDSIAGDCADTSVDDGGWRADCEAWGHTLESTARLVARQYRTQAREFLLLAACTGSSMPEAFERLLAEA